jgi:hypothetical protein
MDVTYLMGPFSRKNYDGSTEQLVVSRVRGVVHKPSGLLSGVPLFGSMTLEPKLVAIPDMSPMLSIDLATPKVAPLPVTTEEV